MEGDGELHAQLRFAELVDTGDDADRGDGDLPPA
jgi:hypothetical protein